VDWTCFGNDDADTVYARRISSAMKRIRRNSPSLLAVFKLIVRNGRNRKESIFQLLTAAERRLPDLEQTQAWSSARLLYWRSLRRLESLFGIESYTASERTCGRGIRGLKFGTSNFF
jgi:hypothetical protein